MRYGHVMLFQLKLTLNFFLDRSPRMQARSKSAIEVLPRPTVTPKKTRSPSLGEEVHSIFNEVKVTCLLPVDRKKPAPTTAAAAKASIQAGEVLTLLCDENIDVDGSEGNKSPDKLLDVPLKQIIKRVTGGRRKTVHKLLSGVEIDDDSEAKNEDEDVDVVGFKKRNFSRENSPEPKRIKYSDEEEDEGIADVLKVPVSKLFELSSDQSGDDIYIGDPFRCIQWENGIGSLRNGSVHFKINEFGIYELMSNDEYYQCKRMKLDKDLEEPIGDRKDKKKKMLPRSFQYECTVCHGSGAADEMLQPNICSWTCKFKWVPEKKERLETPSPETDDDMSQESWVKETEAPNELFKNPVPTNSNDFQTGMKVEVIDPFNQSSFCAATITDKRGYRIKLRFDGYGPEFDIWLNADSKMMFPPGWCPATGRSIDPPPNFPSNKKFNWHTYLKDPKIMAPVQLFPHLKEKEKPSQFLVGAKLEADMPENLIKGHAVTAATISDVIGNQVLIHFDFYDHKYDFWTNIDSPLIHPVKWHEQYNITFKLPSKKQRYKFTWDEYLKKNKAHCVPETAFNPREPIAFRPGMRVEVVDPKNPALLRPAMITHIEGYKLRVLFDGWPAFYAFWINDDSPDLHPVGWHKAAKHPIEHTRLAKGKSADSCTVIPQCRGVGNYLHKGRVTHKLPEECPYSQKNWGAKLNIETVIDKPKEPLSRSRGRPPQNGTSASNSRSESVSSESASVSSVKNPIPIVKIEDDEDKDLSLNLVRLTRNEQLKHAAELLEKHGKNLPQIEKNQQNIYDWTVEQVVTFITKIPGLNSSISEKLMEEKIDGSALICFTKDDLVNELGLKLGPAMKVYNRILVMRQEVLKDLTVP